MNEQFFYLIHTSDTEWSGSYKYITIDRDDAFNHVLQFANWYCGAGCCTVEKKNKDFRTVEKWSFWKGKISEHKVL